MGMYTAYQFRLRLRNDTPVEVLNLLRWLVASDDEGDQPPVPQHPFFLTRRWESIFCGAGGGFEFRKDDGTTFLSDRSFTQDPETGSWLLEAWSQTKGSTQDAALLLDWLKPWLMAAPWEVIAAARYEEEYDYNGRDFFGELPEGAIEGDYHHQYWLVEGKIVERKAAGCVTEIDLPIMLEPNAPFKLVSYYFGREMIEKMREWPLQILPLDEAIVTAVKKELEFSTTQYVRDNLIATLIEAPKRELRTNHPDIKVEKTEGGLYRFTYPFGFNPNQRKVRVRRNLAAPIPRQQARGYYVHSHKGRGFRQGVPRPKMGPIITIEEDTNKPVAETLKPWVVLAAEKGPHSIRAVSKEDYAGPPIVVFDTENSLDVEKLKEMFNNNPKSDAA